MKRLAILFLCWLVNNSCFSQQNEAIKDLLLEVKEASYYDSSRLFKTGEKALSKATATSNKAAEAEVHLYYGNYFFYTRNLEKAKSYFEQSLVEATNANDLHLNILAKIRLAFIEYEAGDKAQGEKEMFFLLNMAKKVKDYENVAELLNLIGISKEARNKPQDAVKLYLEGLALAETNNLKYYPAVFRNNLGLIKYFNGQSDDAIEDFTKGLEIAEKENNRRLASHIQINMCVLYISKNHIKEAEIVLNQVLSYFKNNKLPQEMASAFLNISSAFAFANKPLLALPYTDSAITVLQKYSLNKELTRAYLSKADLLTKMKKETEASAILKQAKILSKKTGSLDDIAACFMLSYQLESQRNNYKEALSDFTAYISTKDSMDKIFNGKMLKEMQLKYNIQKKETELEKEKTKTALLEKSNQKERFTKWVSMAVAFFIMLLVMSFVYVRYLKKIREKQEFFSRQLIENIEGERLRIARDLHDDIGQSLSMIKSKISTGKKEEAQNLEGELGRVIEQTREISKNLYPSYLEKIGLVRSVARLVENIQASTKLECSFEIADEVDLLSINTKTHIYRILQECVNNTIKHAGASALKISISHTNNEYQLIYLDNGKGLEDIKGINGMGLFSIKERAKIINGNLNFSDKTHSGFKLILKFKHHLA